MTVRLQYEIRKEFDVEIILETGRQELIDIYDWITTDNLRFQMEHNTIFAFCAYNQTTPIGIIVCGKEEEGRNWIELLSVNHNYQKQGIGKALVMAAVQETEIADKRALFVDVDDDNYNAIKFYKSVGFVKSGKIQHYYYDKSSALIFRFDIKHK